jgi:hypothetical protein
MVTGPDQPIYLRARLAKVDSEGQSSQNIEFAAVAAAAAGVVPI